MFGPNTRLDEIVRVVGSHRDIHFANLLKRVRARFIDVFKLQDYDILFIPGNSSIGIEAVMHSLIHHVEVNGPDAKFTNRWEQVARRNSLVGKSKEDSWKFYCQLESSLSRVMQGDADIVDATISFPFYLIPPAAKIFITTTEKQLGCMAGMSIVGVRKDIWDDIDRRERGFDYLNLRTYRDKIPYSYNIYIFEELRYQLTIMNYVNIVSQIDVVSDMLVQAIGENNLIGEIKCPVITVKKQAIPLNLAKDYELYAIHDEMSPYYQIFTYSEHIDVYREFADAVKMEK